VPLRILSRHIMAFDSLLLQAISSNLQVQISKLTNASNQETARLACCVVVWCFWVLMTALCACSKLASALQTPRFLAESRGIEACLACRHLPGDQPSVSMQSTSGKCK
jgi:hypothetical protein